MQCWKFLDLIFSIGIWSYTPNNKITNSNQTDNKHITITSTPFVFVYKVLNESNET